MKRKIPILPFALITFLFILLNLYVLSGVHILSSNALVTPLFWSVVLLITGALIYSIRSIQTRGMGLFFKVATHAFQRHA